MSAEIASPPAMSSHGPISALEPIPPHAIMPGEVMGKGQQLAEACKKIVLATTLMLPGEGGKEKRYIRAEGWMALAAGMGLSPRISRIEVVDGQGSTSATCQLIRVYDGEVVAEAEGFVGSDELMWFGGSVTKNGRSGPYTKTYQKRPQFAIRAMAQTRAVSRACRTALAWVVPLMNQVGLVATPAEEMEADQDQYEDYPQDRQVGMQRHTVSESPQQPTDLATKAQLEALGVLLKQVGTTPELLAEIKRRFGASSQMTSRQADEAITYLKFLSRSAACLAMMGGMTQDVADHLKAKWGISNFMEVDAKVGPEVVAYLESLVG